MQETKKIGLELWIGLWCVAGLTAMCLALVGAGWHHLLIGLVAFALAYAPVRIRAELRRRRGAVEADGAAATVTPIAAAAATSDDADRADGVDESPARAPRRDVDQVA